MLKTQGYGSKLAVAVSSLLIAAVALTAGIARGQVQVDVKKPAEKAEKAAPAPAPAADVKDAAKDTARDVKDAAKNTADTARDAARDARRDARDAVRDTRDSARDAARDTRGDADRTRDAARDRVDNARDRVDDARDRARDRATTRTKDRDDRRDERADDAARTRDRREDRRDDARDARRDRRDRIGLTFADGTDRGLVVRDVARGLLGGLAGFRNGDVIVSANGKPVGSYDEFNSWFIDAGPRLPIVVRRDGRDFTLYTTGDRISDNRRGGAYLGVVLDGQSRNEAAIRTVNEKSPAEEAGLRSGDVILAINGDDIRSPQDLISAVNRLSPGDEAEFQIASGDQTETLRVMMGSKPRITGRYEVGKPVTPEVRPAVPSNRTYDDGTRGYRGTRRDRVRGR